MAPKKSKKTSSKLKNWFQLRDSRAAPNQGYNCYDWRPYKPRACSTTQFMWDALGPINKEIISDHVVIPIRVISVERNRLYYIMKVVFGETTMLRKKGQKLESVDRRSFKLKPDGRKVFYRVFHASHKIGYSRISRTFSDEYNTTDPVKQLRKIREIHLGDKQYNARRQIDCRCKTSQNCTKDKRMN